MGAVTRQRAHAAESLSTLAMALVGTTCCALPLVLVAAGAGGAVASLAASAPWLVGLSHYKAWIFAATGASLAFAAWRARGVAACDLADAHRLRRQRRILAASAVLLGVSLCAAYGLLPLVRALEGGP